MSRRVRSQPADPEDEARRLEFAAYVTRREEARRAGGSALVEFYEQEAAKALGPDWRDGCHHGCRIHCPSEGHNA